MKKLVSLLLIVCLTVGLSFAEKNSAALAGKGKLEISADYSKIAKEAPYDGGLLSNNDGGDKPYTNKYTAYTTSLVYGLTNFMDIGFSHVGTDIDSLVNSGSKTVEKYGLTGYYSLLLKMQLPALIFTDATALKFKGSLTPQKVEKTNVGNDDDACNYYREWGVELAASKKITKKLTVGAGLGALQFQTKVPDENGFSDVNVVKYAITYSIGADYQVLNGLTTYVKVSGQNRSDKVGKMVTDDNSKDIRQKADSEVVTTVGLMLTI